jgi:hypothetical protein
MQVFVGGGLGLNAKKVTTASILKNLFHVLFLMVHKCIVLQFANIEAVDSAESASTMQPQYSGGCAVTILKLKVIFDVCDQFGLRAVLAWFWLYISRIDSESQPLIRPAGCRRIKTFRSADMMNLEEIKRNTDLVNSIDWEMTPEEAVRLYLEWGNNWTRGNYVIRSKDDVSHYFVVNTWKDEPVIYFIRRNSDEAVELAEIRMPNDLKKRYLQALGRHKGVWALEGEVKSWLKRKLDVQ